IPATWTDLDPKIIDDSVPVGSPSLSALLGSISDLLHTCTIVDALLRRLNNTQQFSDMSLPTEESKRETTTGSLACHAQAPNASPNMGNDEPRSASHSDCLSSPTDQKNDPSRKPRQKPGEQP